MCSESGQNPANSASYSPFFPGVPTVKCLSWIALSSGPVGASTLPQDAQSPAPGHLGDHLGSLILQRTDSPSTHQMLVKVRCGPELTPDNPTVSFQTPGKKTGQETQLLRDLIIQPENTRMRSVAKECCSDLRLTNNSE